MYCVLRQTMMTTIPVRARGQTGRSAPVGEPGRPEGGQGAEEKDRNHMPRAGDEATVVNPWLVSVIWLRCAREVLRIEGLKSLVPAEVGAA